eukprot:Nitzschia sp. Nitz4//scaffold43_size134323//5968//9728//NITZ4_003276-RA/size134323-augustus-gene-0.212-mRNA-1//1//CDS//3329551879//1856//frame0
MLEPSTVASLAERSPSPFSSLSLSPSRKYAVVASNDSLLLVRIGPLGIERISSFKISQYLQKSVVKEPRAHGRSTYGDVRDTFGLGVKQPAHSATAMGHAAAIVTVVAWSPPLGGDAGTPSAASGSSTSGDNAAVSDSSDDKPGAADGSNQDFNTLVAASGSNGAIAIWYAQQSFFPDGKSNTPSALANQQPQAILGQAHSRAVNALAWHPTRPGIFLSASQDATVKLWHRKKVAQRKEKEGEQRKGFGIFRMQAQSRSEYTWHCQSTFEPKSEAVLDVQWSRFQDDVFALVTVSGSLVVYSMQISHRSLVKIAAHAGDATSLDWHPTKPFTIATGGAGDRCVKVWDLEAAVNMKADDALIALNSLTWNTAKSELSANSTSSNDTDRSTPTGAVVSFSNHSGSLNSSSSRPLASSAFGRSKHSPSRMKHVITIGLSVTTVRWRPPALKLPNPADPDVVPDPHESMLAVATARITNAGGSGVISLWSTNRPFMPLSVVEGHEEGAVAEFLWVETPQYQLWRKQTSGGHMKRNVSDGGTVPKSDPRRHRKTVATADDTIVVRSGSRGDTESILFDNKKEQATPDDPTGAIWQHVLSVGRDGRCILQSLVRGDRPISRVPSSCFAMANLSPFQRGYGSLQVFSVHQQVPNGIGDDSALTALRRDEVTARAPGVFRELSSKTAIEPVADIKTDIRLPESTPELIFNVVDQGPLDANGLPLPIDDDIVCVAPEVVHLSRFASSYKLYPDSACPTRADLCIHNGAVADSLRCGSLARMWVSIAGMLRGSGLDVLPVTTAPQPPMNAMQFAIVPTVRALLLERAEAGDVQTCVAICEVLQVVEEAEERTRIPGLEINVVREWYLSYIELLQQMCLWVAATQVIKNCKDPFINALNKQSTTINESCPRCGKAFETTPETVNNAGRLSCKNCRRRVGLCFLCHEPVKGIFVWCPGCGHGGHLEHALEWFGGINGGTARESCPTGCGHRCNLVQTVSAFPRTDSLKCLPTLDSNGTDWFPKSSED